MPGKTQQYLANRRDEIRAAPDAGTYSEATSQAILDFLDAYNADVVRIQPPVVDGDRDDTLSTSSRLSYASTLHRTAKYVDLLDADADDLNRHADARRSGRHESAKSGGVSANTVHQNQIGWRKFYTFHHHHDDGADVEAETDDIILIERDDPSVDERDMFDADEVQAMRNATQNKRDRALLEMLIYTGQRHFALRTLRYKDVKPNQGESGVIYLNDADNGGEGLKGAKGKRPLLGAQKAVREWQRAHPTQEPEDAFLTHVCDWSNHPDIEPGDELSSQAFGKIPKRIAERADVDKPANPHAFRHYFVTMAASKHGMSFDTLRHLLGHQPGSRELERTYQHLVDDDHIENAERDMEIREKREESLTPSVCPTCDEPLDPDWSVCPNCERIFGPDAQHVKDEVQQAATQDALDVESEETKEDLQQLLALVQDPETLDQLTELVSVFNEQNGAAD